MICLSDKVAILKPVKILNSQTFDKTRFTLAMCYDPDDEKHSLKGGFSRTVKDDAFAFGTESMYVSAAHFLLNRVIIEEGIFRGRSGHVKVVKSVLNETIWELARTSQENEKKRKRREKDSIYDLFSKPPKIIENAK